MKNPIKHIEIMLAAALIMTACVAAQAQQADPPPAAQLKCLFCDLPQEQPVASPPPVPATPQAPQTPPPAGKSIRLAVLEPAGKGLAEDEQWMLSVVQNVIYTDFNKYSGMVLIDKQNIEKVQEEWEKSMSGDYSDKDQIKIGNLTNASHILSGTVIKTPNAFMLELSVTDLQSGERKASYSQPVSASALENHSAVKAASAELMTRLGVTLTSAALGELKQAANITRIQADEALARGIKAQRQGTEVAALSYFFQAAALDPSLAEAVNRSSVMAANVSSGNIGDDTRNDIAWRKSWVKRLEETEQHIDRLNKTAQLPYTLFYSDEIIRGDVNYKNETISLSIKTNLHGSNSIRVWALSVEKALQAVYDGLEATKRKDTWGLNWPYNSVTKLNAFERQGRNFTVAVELVNSRSKVIGRQEFQTGGYWEYDTRRRPDVRLYYLGRTGDGRRDVVFKNVNANDITDNLTIRFASVNGEAAETAARKGVLQIRAMSKRDFDDNDQYTFAYGEIKKYNVESGGNLNIPNTIWNDPVISIGEGAFSNKSLTGVTIPNGVISIGSSAFIHNKLTDVTIPNSVTSIGGGAFYYGNDLTRITIGENVRLGDNVFLSGFGEYYQKSDRRAGAYRRTSDNSSWDRVMTEEEKEEWRQRLQNQRVGAAATLGSTATTAASYNTIEQAEAEERRLQEVKHAEEKRLKEVDEHRHQVQQKRAQRREAWLDEASRTGFKSIYWGGGVLLMLHQYGAPIDIPSFSFLNGQFNAGFTFAFGGADFFHIGMNFDVGSFHRHINPNDAERIRDGIQVNYPDIPRDDIEILASGSTKVNFLARLYMGNNVYLAGGGGWWWHDVFVEEDSDWGLDEIPLVSFKGSPVYTVGIGVVLSKIGGVFLESHYNILPYNTGYFDGYLTINIGWLKWSSFLDSISDHLRWFPLFCLPTI